MRRSGRLPWASMTVLLACVALGLACVRRSVVSTPHDSAPAPGLYEVVERVCSKPAWVPESSCSRTQFIELVRGTFHGVRPDQIALVVWSADDPAASDYTYSARPLRGHYLDAGAYLVEDGPLAKEWLLVEADLVRELHHQRYRVDSNKEVIADTRLQLRRVERSAELAQRLAYPEPE
ncbi:MAG: hypothetical protein JWN48_4287 [Myxococcaceae bacterium]|nr:hypothetical protein [Myxococcaceae bacterium]